MPSKKKKYNARFPAGRIKKIMQSDEEVGKVAQAVPVIISRTLELFVESLLTKTLRITNSRNAKTLSPSHMKQCIMSENRFDFLRELVKYIPDISIAEELGQDSSPGPPTDNTHGALDYRLPSTSSEGNISSMSNGVPLIVNGLQDSIKDYSNSNLASHSKTEQKKSLKRQWESDDNRKNINKSLRSLRSKENTVITHSTQNLESSPPKLSRMDSAPVASLDLSKDSKKRLMHQSKSVPCGSNEDNPSLPVVPAPIVDSICNKPIVKIDYSNLILPEKDSSSGSSSDQNSSNTCISPVIKIDLSKITTTITQPRSNLQAISMSTTSVKSSFELDEDYDNI